MCCKSGALGHHPGIMSKSPAVTKQPVNEEKCSSRQSPHLHSEVLKQTEIYRLAENLVCAADIGDRTFTEIKGCQLTSSGLLMNRPFMIGSLEANRWHICWASLNSSLAMCLLWDILLTTRCMWHLFSLNDMGFFFNLYILQIYRCKLNTFNAFLKIQCT